MKILFAMKIDDSFTAELGVRIAKGWEAVGGTAGKHQENCTERIKRKGVLGFCSLVLAGGRGARYFTERMSTQAEEDWLADVTSVATKCDDWIGLSAGSHCNSPAWPRAA